MAVLVVVVAAAVVAAEQPPPPPQQQQQQQRWDTYAAAMLGQGSDLHAASFNPDSFLAEAEEWCASTDRCEAFTYHLEPAVPAAAAVAGSAPAAAPAPSCPPEACNGHSNRTFCPTDLSPGQCDKPPSPQCPPGPCPNPIIEARVELSVVAADGVQQQRWRLAAIFGHDTVRMLHRGCAVQLQPASSTGSSGLAGTSGLREVSPSEYRASKQPQQKT